MPKLSVFDHVIKNLESLEIDQIVKLLGPLKIGMTVETPIIDRGTFLYRGRKLDDNFRKEKGIKIRDLSYPLPEHTKLGRVNREKKPVFYCTASKEGVVFEVPGVTVGDEVILGFWQTSEKMLVNNVGYTRHLFKKMGTMRECPNWSSRQIDEEKDKQKLKLNDNAYASDDARIALTTNKNNAIRQVFSEAFMSVVNEGEEYKYKLTTAISELHLGEIVNSPMQFAGILYPAMRMSANGDNLALLPYFVDRHVKFKKAMQIRINSKIENTFSVDFIDSATEVSEDGFLKWLGRLPNLKMTSGEMVVAVGTAGRDEHGDYQLDENGNPCHWVISDPTTGKTIQMS